MVINIIVAGFPKGILDNESRKRLEPRSGSVRFTPELRSPSLLRFTPGLRPSAKHPYVCEVINHLPRLGIPSTVKPVTYINEILPFTLID